MKRAIEHISCVLCRVEYASIEGHSLDILSSVRLDLQPLFEWLAGELFLVVRMNSTLGRVINCSQIRFISIYPQNPQESSYGWLDSRSKSSFIAWNVLVFMSMLRTSELVILNLRKPDCYIIHRSLHRSIVVVHMTAWMHPRVNKESSPSRLLSVRTSKPLFYKLRSFAR